MRRRTSQSGPLGAGDALKTLSSLSSRASGPNLAALAAPAAPMGAARRRGARAPRAAAAGVSAPSLFRSEDMILVRLYLDRAAAHCTVDELGELGVCQFADLNGAQSAFQRAFSNSVRRCDEMLRVARFLVEQVARVDGLVLAPPPDVLGGSPAGALRLDDLDAHLQSLERTLLELNANEEALAVQYNQTCELRAVLDKCAAFFRDAPRAVHAPAHGRMAQTYRGSEPVIASVRGEFAALNEPPSIAVDDMPGEEELARRNGGVNGMDRARSMADGVLQANGPGSLFGQSGLLAFLTGTLAREKVPAFERVLFRATHGNCIVRFADIAQKLVDPETGESMQKSVFMVFFSGAAVRAKITKICDSFSANRYKIPEDHGTQMIAIEQCAARLGELKAVSSVTSEQRRASLLDVAANLNAWRFKITREMGVFHTLNLLNYDTSNRLFIAEAWCPASAEDSVRSALEVGKQRSNAQVSSVLEVRAPVPSEKPPTYYKTNKFTEVFQSIVESYGIAKYKEVNPSPYAIITFPFLFAVMFGDIGHGLVMTAFAAYLVLNERRLGASKRRLNEMLVMCFNGRYLILLMGLFSVYTGFIYNELFAVPVDLFGSRWKFPAGATVACGIDNCLDPAAVKVPLEPYPFGFDPVWKASKTGLVFFNSYKMKLSIVLGVTQMVMGICLSYSNARFFREPLDIWHVFVPQMIFMNSIFGYLVFLILFKWLKDFDSPLCRADPGCVPPDLKSILIGMFMSPNELPAELKLFEGQLQVQQFLLVAALVAVPWMLLPKPLILRARHNNRKEYGLVPGSDDDLDGSMKAAAPAPEGFDFGEAFVHQMIHTIEFVLGAVSNTASYLRLWALSLAHAELSNVFLEKLLFRSIESGSPVLMIVGFFMWVNLTLGVLMGMESLSAFLHTLRLHWVEFQNKFYLLHGDGNKFEPFDHGSIRVDEED